MQNGVLWGRRHGMLRRIIHSVEQNGGVQVHDIRIETPPDVKAGEGVLIIRFGPRSTI
jgi:hypothetical protein